MLKQTPSVIEMPPNMERCATGDFRPNSGQIGHKLRTDPKKSGKNAASGSVNQMTLSGCQRHIFDGRASSLPAFSNPNRGEPSTRGQA
jgi:hypothetical protein